MYWECRKNLTACHMWFHSVAYLLYHQKLYPLKHCQNYFSPEDMLDVPFKSHIISFLFWLVQCSICSTKFLWRLTSSPLTPHFHRTCCTAKVANTEWGLPKSIFELNELTKRGKKVSWINHLFNHLWKLIYWNEQTVFYLKSAQCWYSLWVT